MYKRVEIYFGDLCGSKQRELLEIDPEWGLDLAPLAILEVEGGAEKREESAGVLGRVSK